MNNLKYILLDCNGILGGDPLYQTQLALDKFQLLPVSHMFFPTMQEEIFFRKPVTSG